MLDRLIPDAAPIHYRKMVLQVLKSQKNLKYLLNARCISIDENGVTYIDKNCLENTLKVGTVVISVGMKPKTDKVLEFVQEVHSAGMLYYPIGDCAHQRGNVQKAIRSAFAAASQI
jgi:thioredoxin reductase